MTYILISPQNIPVCNNCHWAQAIENDTNDCQKKLDTAQNFHLKISHERGQLQGGQGDVHYVRHAVHHHQLVDRRLLHIPKSE